MFRICQRKNDLISEQDIFEKEAKEFFIELGVYIIFLILAISMYYLNENYVEHYQMKTMQRLFVDRLTDVEEVDYHFEFLEMKTALDFWKYLETTFLYGLHGHPNTTIAVQKERFVAFENLLMGYPRIRQVRVKKNAGCMVHPMFTKQFHDCYERYDMTRENISKEYKGTKYRTATQTNNFITYANIASYNGGGYIKDLSYSREENLKIIESLKESEWIDRATRLVSVELALYNGNIDVYCEIKLAIEVLPTGGVFPFHSIRVFHVIRLVEPEDYVLVIVMFCFYSWILVYFVNFCLNLVLHETRVEMFFSIWTYLDLLIVTLGFWSLTIFLYLPHALTSYIKDNDKISEYHGMDKLSMCDLIYSNSTAVLIFFIWVKAFKFIGFNRTMLQFSTTLSRCAKDLLGFGFMFLIVFLAFAALGVLLFGSQNSEFSNLTTSVTTMMRFILGDFDYVAIEKSNRVLGPIFFVSYIILVFFILLNMFLAIVNDTYAEVKTIELEDKSYLWLYLAKIFRKCCKKKEPSHGEDSDQAEPRRLVRERKRTEKIIEDQHKVMDNLFKVVEQKDSIEFSKLEKRVAVVEGSVERLHERLDILIVRLKRKADKDRKIK